MPVHASAALKQLQALQSKAPMAGLRCHHRAATGPTGGPTPRISVSACMEKHVLLLALQSGCPTAWKQLSGRVGQPALLEPWYVIRRLTKNAQQPQTNMRAVPLQIDPKFQGVVDLIRSGHFGYADYFNDILNNVTTGSDYYLVANDFPSYIEAQVSCTHTHEAARPAVPTAHAAGCSTASEVATGRATGIWVVGSRNSRLVALSLLAAQWHHRMLVPDRDPKSSATMSLPDYARARAALFARAQYQVQQPQEPQCCTPR